MGLPDLEATIARLEAAAADARQAASEANSATKALRHAERDAKAAIAEVQAAAVKVVEERLAEAVGEGLKEYAATLRKAAHDGYDHVMDQFTRISNIAMYGNEQGRGENIFDQLRQRALEMEQTFGRPGELVPRPDLPALWRP